MEKEEKQVIEEMRQVQSLEFERDEALEKVEYLTTQMNNILELYEAYYALRNQMELMLLSRKEYQDNSWMRYMDLLNKIVTDLERIKKGYE